MRVTAEAARRFLVARHFLRHALCAYLRFAGASRLEWAPHLAAEKQLFPS